MKYRITCNPYHARSVRPNASGYIFTLRKVKHSFSPTCIDFAVWLLCRTREEPNATPLALLALLLLLLPLLLTLQKFVLLEALGERNHQFVAHSQDSVNNYKIQCLTYKQSYGKFLYRSLSDFITALTRRISKSIISNQFCITSISIPKSSCATSS